MCFSNYIKLFVELGHAFAHTPEPMQSSYGLVETLTGEFKRRNLC